jgi:hypothetical protein
MLALIAQKGEHTASAGKLAYERSNRTRDALPLEAYRTALQTGRIGEELAAELTRRVERKRQLRHVDQAPQGCLG